MSYLFDVVRPDGTLARVEHPVRVFEVVRAEDASVTVRASWCAASVHRRRHASDQALLHAWPGEYSLTVYRASDTDPEAVPVEVFSGPVTSVELDPDLVTVVAFSSAPSASG